MSTKETKKEKKPFLYLSLLANLGLLGYFKYTNFFISNINEIYHLLGNTNNIPYLDIVLPVGISFYTFQTLSYTIDIYFGELKAEKHFPTFALYVTFFPQLVAGPIERASTLIKQLNTKNYFDQTRVRSGLQLMAFGLFKKIVVADQCGVIVDNGVLHGNDLYGASWWVINILFGFQIYCDFSGYSDIARGAAEIMGYDLMINFRQPFLSKSIIELWNNWHISLTTWFKDYVFKPLSKGQKNKYILLFNIFLIYFISGFWHGANWTYIIWGSFQGIMIVIYQLTKKSRKKLKKNPLHTYLPNVAHVLEVTFTFFIFCVTGLYFRLSGISTLSDIWDKNISTYSRFGESISDMISNENNLRQTLLYMGHDIVFFGGALVAIFFLIIFEILQKKHISGRILLNKQPIYIRWSFYIFLIIGIVIGSATIKQPFIYFQF